MLRVAVALGFCVDAVVAILALRSRTRRSRRSRGGEYIVVALVYMLVFREPERYRALLWLCALDQALAVLLPAIEIARGNVVATDKTIGPIPFNSPSFIQPPRAASRSPSRP